MQIKIKEGTSMFLFGKLLNGGIVYDVEDNQAYLNYEKEGKLEVIREEETPIKPTRGRKA